MTRCLRGYLRFGGNVSSFVLAGFVLSTAVHADDWPQWRGQDRRAVWDETGIVEDLPKELLVKWRVPVGTGFSGPSVADGRVFITDWREDPRSRTLEGTERLIVLDEATGDLLWTHEWETSYRMLMTSYAIGPRATQSIDGERVNSTGRRNTSMMRCCNAETETEKVRPGGSACDAFAWSAAGNGACGAATVLEGDRAGAVE